MKIRKLKYYLECMRDKDYGWDILNFSDQDDDYYIVNEVFVDEDGDICLYSKQGYGRTGLELLDIILGDHQGYSVIDLLDLLAGYDDSDYVYFKFENEEGNDLICDIEGGWYVDQDNNLTMDVCYHKNNDDDDDNDGDSFSFTIGDGNSFRLSFSYRSEEDDDNESEEDDERMD